jgi:hypothetical protein
VSDSTTVYTITTGASDSFNMYIDELPDQCIFCMPEADTPARCFIQDDRGYNMPYCDRHYQEALASYSDEEGRRGWRG